MHSSSSLSSKNVLLTTAILLVVYLSSSSTFAFQAMNPRQTTTWTTGTASSLPSSSSSSSSSSSTTTSLLFLFNKLGDAFKNDDSLGKVPDAGLKDGPKFNQQVTVNDIPVPGSVAGQKLTIVANKVRVRIPVNCQKGDCGTCMVLLNGRKVKACQTPLPSGKAVIKTL